MDNELWIMVCGGNSDDERIIATGNMKQIEKAVAEYSEEVMLNADKYFELITSTRNYTFYSYRDFVALNLM